MPRKGIISKVPYSNTRQFGISTLWRKKRQQSTDKALRSILNAPLFQNRVRMWTLLQDLGSNTRRRYEQTRLGVYYLKLTKNWLFKLLMAPFISTKEKPLAESAHFGHLGWYFGIKHTAVPCHEPSFRLIYVKHPSLMDAICNHKEAIQNWSDEIPPTCTCSILQQFPSARAFPNLKCEHWVLDGALLAPLLWFARAVVGL